MAHLTHFSSAPMSVSSSHGLTSSKMEDFAITAGFFDFFSAYAWNPGKHTVLNVHPFEIRTTADSSNGFFTFGENRF